MNNYSDIQKKTLIIVPAYNAAKSIENVIDEILVTGFYNIVVGDDCSIDGTAEIIKKKYPKIKVIQQSKNLGYGGNQKSLYNYAIDSGFDFIVMIHGDLQYTPRLIPSLASMMFYAKYDFVFGSRITGGNAISGGMPFYKYLSNRLLTFFQNIVTGRKLSEYHSGLRGFRVHKIKRIAYTDFSDDFIFDNQIILAVIKSKFSIGEISCETVYNHNSSSISFIKSVIYGIGVISESIKFLFSR